MDIKKIIKEEIDGFDWIDGVSPQYNIDTKHDHMRLWSSLKEVLEKYNISVENGEVHYDDYEGEGWVNLDTNMGFIEIGLTSYYDQEENTITCTYNIYHDNRKMFDEKYEPGFGHPYQRLFDKLEELFPTMLKRYEH